MKAVFLDRDGTINAGIPKYERVDSVDKLEILPTVMEALGKLARTDYGAFLITNQAGISEGLITEEEFETINDHLLKLIAPSGVKILKTYVCPHGEASNCLCRKPKPGMITQAAEEFEIDLAQSWVVGDRETDVLTGLNAGTKAILVQSGSTLVTSKNATYTAKNLLESVDYIIAHDSPLVQ